MRPGTIIWFERLYLATLALSLVVAVLDWTGTSEGVGTPAAVAILAVVLAVTMGLVLLVSRRRSQAVKWVLVLVSLLASIGLAFMVQVGLESPRDQADFALALVQVCATLLLFTPSARAWLATDPETRSAKALERTFE